MQPQRRQAAWYDGHWATVQNDLAHAPASRLPNRIVLTKGDETHQMPI